MHVFRSAENGIDRASLNAQGATDTEFLNDDSHLFNVAVFTMLGIERFGVNAEQIGQGMYGRLAARRTLVDISFTIGDGFRIRTATGECALTALCLRQDGVNLLHYGVTLHFKPLRGHAQQ